jgi:predicted RNA methylase
MSTKTRKQYSLSYWIKQALRHESQPERVLAELVTGYHRDPASCPVLFDGSAHDLLNAAYQEWRKYMKGVHLCLFPTPMPVARRLADLMKIGSRHTVFDPGTGTGNLLAAAMERGATAYGLEFQYWLPDLLRTIGIECVRGDFLDQPPPLPPANVIMVNPPFGRIGESSDATTDFMERIADIARAPTTVGAILPAGHFTRGPKRRREVAERFETHETIPLDASTFRPLTCVATEMHLMTVKHSGVKQAPARRSLYDQLKLQRTA